MCNWATTRARWSGARDLLKTMTRDSESANARDRFVKLLAVLAVTRCKATLSLMTTWIKAISLAFFAVC